MSNNNRFDLCFVESEYSDVNGNRKKRYKKCGILVEMENGNRFIKLDRTFNPAGVITTDRGEVMISIFEQRNNEIKAPTFESSEVPF